MKRWRNILIGIIVSAFFLWVALRGLAWDEVGSILKDARWIYVLPASAIWSLGLAFRAVRWRILMGKRVGLMSSFHIINIGFLVNNTLPFRVGELARAYLIGRGESNVSGWAALSTIVTERVVDMLAVVLMLVAVLPTLPVDSAAVTSAFVMGGIALLGFVMLLALAHHPQWTEALLDIILRLLPILKRFGLQSLASRLLDGIQPLTSWRTLLDTAFWTVISWGTSIAGSWALAMAFPDLPQTAVMRAALTLSVVAASFSLIIPFTLAAVGPFEAAAVFALLTANVSQEVAVTYAVVWHAGTVLLYAIWGATGMIGLGLSFGQIQKGAVEFKDETAPTASD